MTNEVLTVVIPVYNERETIERLVAEWTASLSPIPALCFTLLLCEDGSTDGTKEIIRRMTSYYPVTDASVKERRGYAKAVRDGIAQASSEWVLCIDGDGQCPAIDFQAFWSSRHDADFVMGWRKPRRDPFIRLVCSRVFFLCHRLLFGHTVHDPSCPYVLGRKQTFAGLLPYLAYMDEGFWWGFVAACKKTRTSIKELPITHAPRAAGKTQIHRFSSMPSIFFRNFTGLLALWRAAPQ